MSFNIIFVSQSWQSHSNELALPIIRMNSFVEIYFFIFFAQFVMLMMSLKDKLFIYTRNRFLNT